MNISPDFLLHIAVNATGALVTMLIAIVAFFGKRILKGIDHNTELTSQTAGSLRELSVKVEAMKDNIDSRLEKHDNEIELLHERAHGLANNMSEIRILAQVRGWPGSDDHQAKRKNNP